MVAKQFNVGREPMGRALEGLRRRLEGYRACISVAASALKHQNADADADIAIALMRGAGDPLLDDMECVERWAAQLKREKPLLCVEGKKLRRRPSGGCPA